MAASEQAVRERLLRLRLQNLSPAVSRPGPVVRLPEAEREALAARTALAAETPSPFLVGAGKFFTDVGIAARQIGVLGVEVLNETPIGPGSQMSIGDMLPMLLDINREDFNRLAREAENNQELFDILAARSPSAKTGEFLAMLGSFLVFPEAKVAAGTGKTALQRTLTAPRRMTVTTETGASVAASVTIPGQSPEELAQQFFFGLAVGPAAFGVSTFVSAAGRTIVGGRPSSIQNTAELLQAEKDLGVVGLLTTGEARQGRILGKIEGVLDNLPIPFLGLSGRRAEQQIGFDNAVNYLRTVFPDVSHDQALRVIRGQLNANVRANKESFRRVALSVSDDAALVVPDNYVRVAERMRVEELAKGERADQSVISFLTEQSEVSAVPFSAAQGISVDLGTRIRAAERAAQGPTQTALDAGRLKQLSMAHFKDLELWARNTGGETLDLWNVAKKEFKETILPFQKRPLAPMFDDQGFDSYTMSQLLLDPVKAGKLAKLDEGSALGFLVFNDALEQASIRNGVVDVKKLVTLLSNTRRHKSLERLVPRESMELLVGLAKLVDAAPRAFIRPSQQQMLATTAGTGLALGAGAFLSGEPGVSGAVAGVSFVTLRALIGTKSGRLLLTTAARVPQSNRKLLAQLAARARIAATRFTETGAIAATQRESIEPIPEVE